MQLWQLAYSLLLVQQVPESLLLSLIKVRQAFTSDLRFFQTALRTRDRQRADITRDHPGPIWCPRFSHNSKLLLRKVKQNGWMVLAICRRHSGEHRIMSHITHHLPLQLQLKLTLEPNCSKNSGLESLILMIAFSRTSAMSAHGLALWVHVGPCGFHEYSVLHLPSQCSSAL